MEKLDKTPKATVDNSLEEMRKKRKEEMRKDEANSEIVGPDIKKLKKSNIHIHSVDFQELILDNLHHMEKY